MVTVTRRYYLVGAVPWWGRCIQRGRWAARRTRRASRGRPAAWTAPSSWWGRWTPPSPCPGTHTALYLNIAAWFKYLSCYIQFLILSSRNLVIFSWRVFTTNRWIIFIIYWRSTCCTRRSAEGWCKRIL